MPITSGRARGIASLRAVRPVVLLGALLLGFQGTSVAARDDILARPVGPRAPGLPDAPPGLVGGAETLRVPTVVVSGRSRTGGAGATTRDLADFAPKRAVTSDSSRLLEDIPGVTLYGAGGISGLPVIRGLADDRLRVQVDGVDAMSACPNHMNSPLSYINPTKVARVTVFAGIAPVSAGGDSIGGTIQVDSAPPQFTAPGEAFRATGRLGAFYRSNGHAHGHQFGATLSGERVSLSFDESMAQSQNYRAGRNFKAPGIGSLLPGGEFLEGDVVGSSAFRGSRNREISLAAQHERHLFQAAVSEQSVGFEGFPNQRMDMTDNRNTMVNLRYTGQFDWGSLEARVFEQRTRHRMDMGPNRFSYGTGMPMESSALTRGASAKATWPLSDRHLARFGTDVLTYNIDDWWPPVGVSGSMCCNAFFNLRDGRRDRLGVFGEVETRWTTEWMSLVGLRGDLVRSDADDVQGYSASGIWASDANPFNARDRRRTDRHWSATALLRQEPSETATYEAGFARKMRSPNLYERYAWSTQSMAALMNNFVGDGNGYIGNPDLRPETAYTASLSGDWHDAARDRWGLKATTHYTYVEDYVDARRCNFGQCGGAANVSRTGGFVLLQYANHRAHLYGLDLSGTSIVGEGPRLGRVDLGAIVSYVKGENLTTGDDLYQIMPINAKVSLVHRMAAWTTTLEVIGVDAKTHVSRVRNEVRTPGYGLVNLRTSYEWHKVRVDLAIENVFDRFYSLPLGGAYLGQGPSMTTNGIPWGVAVPGLGRSLNVAVSAAF